LALAGTEPISQELTLLGRALLNWIAVSQHHAGRNHDGRTTTNVFSFAIVAAALV
jgi:hypothetical protein